MKTRLTLTIFCSAAMLMSGCGTPETHISLADLHPASPGSASYDPVKNITTIENGGFSWYLGGNVTNVMLYPEHTPRPIPVSMFESLYRQGNPQTAVAVEYLGQVDGYAYLRVRSIPVKNPKKWSEQIVYVALSELDQPFRDALPPNKVEKP
jgi:hypothetical protein